MIIDSLKHSVIVQFFNRIRYFISDFLTLSIKLGSGIKLLSQDNLTIIGNSPSINSKRLPLENVIVCNHFWRHPHYGRLVSGFHVISDKQFLDATDLKKFTQVCNEKLVIVCSRKIRKELIRLNVRSVILGVNYSGYRRLWIDKPVPEKLGDINYTGSTVVADLAFPLASYLKVGTIVMTGVDLDYSKGKTGYAFDVTNSKLASSWYMENLWKERAFMSVTNWVTCLAKKGVKVEWRRS